MKNPDDPLLTIDGLWSLTFGNNINASFSTTDSFCYIHVSRWTKKPR